jgi:hypothetical protein
MSILTLKTSGLLFSSPNWILEAWAKAVNIAGSLLYAEIFFSLR